MEVDNRRLSSIAHTLLGVFNYTYNSDGLLETETLSNGAKHTWSYDSLNRVAETAATEGNNGRLILQETNGYIAASIRVQSNFARDLAFGGNYYKLYSHDEMLRLKRQQRERSSNSSTDWHYEYTYDMLGNRLSMIGYDGRLRPQPTTHKTI